MTKASSNLQELRWRIYRKPKSATTHRFWGLFVHITKIKTLEEACESPKETSSQSLFFTTLMALRMTAFFGITGP